MRPRYLIFALLMSVLAASGLYIANYFHTEPRQAAPQADLAEENIPFDKGLLWKIEKDGVSPNYVFGTMHLSDPKITTLPREVKAALAESRSVGVEIVFNVSAMLKAMRLMHNEAGKNLEDQIGGKLVQAASAAVEPYGLRPNNIQSMKPWALIAILAMPPDDFRRQQQEDMVLDRVLQDIATRQGKELFGIETVEEQLNVFDSMAISDQVELLRSTLMGLPLMATMFEEMKRLYLERDLGGLLILSNESLPVTNGKEAETVARFMDALVTQRNQKMVERVAPRMEKGGVFMAVGALHLPGHMGVLNLLSEEGYQVSRVY